MTNKHRALLTLLPFLLTSAPLRAQDVDPARSQLAQEKLQQYLQADPEKRPPLEKESFATTPLSRDSAAAIEKLLWEDHVKQIKLSRADEIKDKKIVEGKLEMPFFYTTFGEKPKTGRSLFISMHGGGGAPKALNDSQWENQKHLYKLTEGVYLAPRAPTNNWNLWHESHIDRMFDRLIEDLIVFEDVDPNHVYIMGYSAGGDGVYQLAPRMADRFAAASMMAGHPNDSQPLGLRNLPFAIHVGALDAAYNRNKVAAEWGKKLDDLQKSDPDGYIHVAKLHEGKPHWMDREDAEAIPWMAQYTRNPFPKKVAWKQASTTHDRFYWLAVPKDDAKAGDEITATIQGQQITLETKDAPHVIIRLNDKMLDLDKPITVQFGTQKLFEGTLPRTTAAIAKTLTERGDPTAIFTAELDIKTPVQPKAPPAKVDAQVH